MEFELVHPSPQSLLTEEWQALAELRKDQIRSGTDRSFHDILKPAVLRWAYRLFDASTVPQRLVDIGCGTGELTAALADIYPDTTGIDPSAASVRYARQLLPAEKILEQSSREHAETHTDAYDLAVANMVMMDTVDIAAFSKDAFDLLDLGGHFIATITHPWFWPEYWGYDKAPWFSYGHELFIRANWRISSDVTPADRASTHIHRPLSHYLSSLIDAGLRIEDLEEVPISGSTNGTSSFPYPRFLVLHATKPHSS